LFNNNEFSCDDQDMVIMGKRSANISVEFVKLKKITAIKVFNYNGEFLTTPSVSPEIIKIIINN
jgi:hypothetical protein